MKKMKRKLNNSGAALVLVIVVISFISISATILLYMSAMNFYMKTTDTRIKYSFYDGEKAMEEVRAIMIGMAEDASEKAYSEVMKTYVNTDPADVSAAYKKLFATYFEDAWKANVAINDVSTCETYLRTVVDSKFGTDGILTMTPGIPASSPTTPASEVYKVNTTDGTFELRTVNLTYANAEGYLTMISTDFVVTAPTINFDYEAEIDASADDFIKITNCVVYSNWTKK